MCGNRSTGYRSLIPSLVGLFFLRPSAEAKKPPVFDVPLKALTVNEGEKLSLQCHICGSEPLKIQWMKDRKELTSAGSTVITFSDGTACLDISTTSRHDAGDYLCKATNQVGSEFCKAKVTVKGNNLSSSNSFSASVTSESPFSPTLTPFDQT